MASILEVAKKAAVSPATVSNVYNRPQVVREKTRIRVLNAAAALGYQPNLHAKSLRSRRSSIISILVPDITFSYSALLARGAMDQLKEANYLPVVSNTDGDSATEVSLLRELWQQGVRSFIMAPVQYRYGDYTLDCIKNLQAQGGSFVFIGHQFDQVREDVVIAQVQEGAKMAVDHLVALGHRLIGYIGRQWSKGFAVGRFLGYQEAIMLNELPLRQEFIVEMEEATLENGMSAFNRLFSLDHPPTAILTVNDQLACGILNAAYVHGIRVPDQLSVIGFNDIPMSRLSAPPLTTVALPIYEKGRKAAQLLLKRQSEPNLPPQRITMSCKLVVRNSTAAPPAEFDNNLI